MSKIEVCYSFPSSQEALDMWLLLLVSALEASGRLKGYSGPLKPGEDLS